MYEPKITIVTVVYNGVQTLEQLINSVVNQTYNNIEFIIIDGGSVDGSLDVIGKYQQYIDKWVSESDDGIYNAMNKAVDLATGDYIYFIGADDCLVNRNIIKYIAQNIDDEVDILSAPVWAVMDNGYQYVYSNNNARIKSKYMGGMIPHQGMFVRLSVMKKYHFDESFKIAADYKFFLKCYYGGIRFRFIDRPVAFFAEGGVSSDPKKNMLEDIKIYKQLGVNYKKVEPPFYKKVLKKILIKLQMDESIHKLFIWQKHKCDNNPCRWCGRY